MANYWKIVNRVIYNADVLLLLLDSRMVNETRNPEIEEKIKKAGKTVIYVITKCDLVDKKFVEKYKRILRPSVFVSAKDHLGTSILREKMIIEGKRSVPDKKKITVGVLGYPNVGKSSLINALKGRRAASTSILSGHTRGVQKIKADNRIILLDTPGVIPNRENDANKHAFIGTIDYTKAKNPDLNVIELMVHFPGKIESFYGVEESEDKEETLEKIAIKKKVLKKGNNPDIENMSRRILRDWQKGTIK